MTKKKIIGLALMLPVIIAVLILVVELTIYCFTHYTSASIAVVCMFGFFIGCDLFFEDDKSSN